VQPLRIVIGSRLPAKIISLNEDVYQGVRSQLRTEFLGNPEFEIEEKPYFHSFCKPFTGNQGQKFASLEIIVVAARIYKNYVWSIYFPSIIITTMTGAAYIMPPDQISSRLSVTITLTLVMVAYKYLVASLLPRLKYFTFCDILVQGSFCFVCLAVVENVTASLVITFNSEELGIRVDHIFMIILGILWITFLAYIVTRSIFAQKYEQKKLEDFKEKSDSNKTRSTKELNGSAPGNATRTKTSLDEL